MGADPAVGVARRMAKCLVEEGVTEFTARDAFTRFRGTVETMDKLWPPLRLLESHGYIRAREREHRGPGRKPSPAYDVTPYLHAHNAQNAEIAPLVPNCAHCAHSAQGDSM